MPTIDTLLLGFAPGLFWLWYFRRKDRLEPEPRLLVLKAFALGCGAALAVVWLRPIYQEMLAWFDDSFTRLLVDDFIVTAAAEEGFKIAAVLIPFWAHHEFDEPLDGIVYGIASALGFASVENVYKLIESFGADTMVLLAFTSTLAHVAFTGVAGYFIGRAKFATSRPRAAGLLAVGVGAAVILHGTYDMLIRMGAEPRWYTLIVVLPNVLLLLGLQIRWATAESPHHPPGDRAE